MPTYRAVIQEIIPYYAITAAERRVYDRPNGREDTYMCQEGRCALGVMACTMQPDVIWRHFPNAHDFRGAYEDQSPTVRRRRLALNIIMRANDRGLLATPGSLTALLDRPLKVTVH